MRCWWVRVWNCGESGGRRTGDRAGRVVACEVGVLVCWGSEGCRIALAVRGKCVWEIGARRVGKGSAVSVSW